MKSSLAIQTLANLINCEQMIPNAILLGMLDENAGIPNISKSKSLLLSYTLVEKLVVINFDVYIQKGSIIKGLGISVSNFQKSGINRSYIKDDIPIINRNKIINKSISIFIPIPTFFMISI